MTALDERNWSGLTCADGGRVEGSLAHNTVIAHRGAPGLVHPPCSGENITGKLIMNSVKNKSRTALLTFALILRFFAVSSCCVHTSAVTLRVARLLRVEAVVSQSVAVAAAGGGVHTENIELYR